MDPRQLMPVRLSVLRANCSGVSNCLFPKLTTDCADSEASPEAASELNQGDINMATSISFALMLASKDLEKTSIACCCAKYASYLAE